MQTELAKSANRAPGCFASPSVYSMDSRVCKNCPSSQDCFKACLDTLQQLRSTINVADLLKRHTNAMASVANPASPEKENNVKFMPSHKPPADKIDRKPSVERKTQKFEMSEEDERLAASLNDKPGKEAMRLCKNGMMALMRSDLPAGRNPFSATQPCFMQVCCEELLNGSVTKLSLRNAFMSKLGKKEPWSVGTATSHVNIALQMLEGFKFIQETNGNYQLVRNEV